jgi:hypothetical protein
MFDTQMRYEIGMNTDERKKKMIAVLTHLVYFLGNSESSLYAGNTPDELMQVVKANLANMKLYGVLLSPDEMKNMLLPTSSLQEIAIDNGWGNQYIELAAHFEIALDTCY